MTDRLAYFRRLEDEERTLRMKLTAVVNQRNQLLRDMSAEELRELHAFGGPEEVTPRKEP